MPAGELHLTDDRPLPAAVLAALLARLEDDRAGGGLRSVEAYQALYPGYEDGVAKTVLQVVEGQTVGGEGAAWFLEKDATFGAYRIEGMLGQGGQGVVYRARDERLNRSVALKILDVRGPGLGDAFNRFQREAEVAARLQHPGICSVYESGIEDGVPFIAMQLVEGASLSDAITTLRERSSGATVSFQSTFGGGEGDDDLYGMDDEAAADPDAPNDPAGPDRARMDHVLRIMEQAARAVHAAHEAGVVHRDIKPGNIMVPADGAPVILDFGLAHDMLGEGVTLTRPGDLFGTPAYMSPEQLLHNQIVLDRRTDVWSLGVVLFEYLTCRRPFEAPTRQGLFQVIATRDPADARKINGAIPRDLAVVLETALEKDRDRRYQTALDFAEELRRVREYEPIVARPVGPVGRTVRWAARNPAVAALTAALFISMSAGLVWIGLQNEQLQKKTTEAETNAAALVSSNAELISKTAEANRSLYGARLYAAQVALGAGNVRESKRLHDRCPAPYRNWEWRHLGLSLDQSVRALEGHDGVVNSVGWSPDGKHVVTGSWDTTVRIWDAASGEHVRTLKGAPASWSPDGHRIVSGLRDGTVRIWDAASGTELKILEGHSRPIRSVAWSPDGRRIVSGSYDETVRIWDARSGECLDTMRGHRREVWFVCWSPDGTRIVSASKDATLRIWNAANGASLRTLEGHEHEVFCVCWSPDGKLIASGSKDTTVRIWNAASGETVRVLDGHDRPVRAVCWSLDGTRILTGSGDASLRIWDAATGEPLRTLRGHGDAISSACWSPDGERIVSGSYGHTARIWDTASHGSSHSLAGSEEETRGVDWSPDGKRFASASAGNTLRIWDAATGESLRILEGHEGSVLSLAWSPDGKRLASGAGDAIVGIWDVFTGERLQALEGHQAAVCSVSWSPDGKRLASGSTDSTVRTWDVESGQGLETLAGHGDEVLCVSWSPDGKHLVSASRDKTLYIWDGASGQAVRRLTGHRRHVWSACWSPDGQRILSGSWDRSLRIWDAESGRSLQVLDGHETVVYSVSWAPDGQRIVSASDDKTLRIWDAVNGESLQVLEGHGCRVYCVSWSPDGKRIISGAADGSVRVWESRLEDALPMWRAAERRAKAAAAPPKTGK